MHARAEQAADIRDTIVIVLALAGGAVDAISFLGLGGAFSANMTGNVVLLGAAAGKGFDEALLRSGAALAGYVVGVYVAARAVRAIGGERLAAGELWPGWMTRGLVVVALLECIVLAGWLASDGQPSLAGEATLLAVFALAMGAQAALVHRLGQRPQPGSTAGYGPGAGRRRRARRAARLPGAAGGGLPAAGADDRRRCPRRALQRLSRVVPEPGVPRLVRRAAAAENRLSKQGRRSRCSTRRWGACTRCLALHGPSFGGGCG
ncbi:MAG TPA: YoaK family protein [Solirubrobacterales bacterium]|nr:YoaK family protein [Solirubrobacterales bacterium]